MSGKYQAYPEYKESSYGWLGSVPLDWTVSKTGRFFKIAMGQTILKEQLDENASWPVYSATEKDVFFGYIDQPQVRLAPGDLVIPARGNSIGAVKLVSCNSTTTQTTIYCKHLTRKVSPRYAYYYMLGLRDNLFWFTQTAIPQITVEEVSTNPIVVPSLGEQRTIAAFLDHETARIDRLIEKQQRLIELLKEKRQAVISHAVTKGLDPNVPMKDSGVEWLGQVPTVWKVGRLGYYCQVSNGTTPSKSNLDYWIDGNVPWLASGAVNQHEITDASDFITSSALAECSLNLLPRGTVVIGMIGQGRTRGMAAITRIKATINQNLAAAVPNQQIDSEFLLCVVQSAYTALRETGRGGNQAALNCELIADLKITIPTFTEQQEIVSYLNEKNARFEALMDRAVTAVKLLQERRTAMISAAVTGKIDVRNWRPNTSTQAIEPDLPMAAEQAAEYQV